MHEINIAKKNKAEVLIALYGAASSPGLGMLHRTEEPMSIEEAEELVANQPYFDYLKGRVMKIDLRKDTMRTDLYNRDNGFELAERLIEELPDVT